MARGKSYCPPSPPKLGGTGFQSPSILGATGSQSPPELGSQCGLGVSQSRAPGVDLGGEKSYGFDDSSRY